MSQATATATNLIDDVRAVMHDDEVRALESYRDLVEAVAGGRPFAPGVELTARFVADCLADYRKSPEELEADVAVMRKRIALAAKVVAGEKAKKDHPAAYAEYRAAVELRDLELKLLTEKHKKLVGAADARCSDAVHAILEAETARAHLISSAPPFAARRLMRLRDEEIPRLEARIAKAESDLAGVRELYDLYRGLAEKGQYANGQSAEETKATAKEYAGFVRDGEKAVASLEAERDGLAAEAVTLEEVSLEAWHPSCPDLR